MTATRQAEWQEAELVWIRPSDIVVPHCILDQEQAEALRVLIAPE
jgi:hypothetical protein